MRISVMAFAIAIAASLLIGVPDVLAQASDVTAGLDITAGQAGLQKQSSADLIAGLVQAAIGLIGMVFFLLLIYGGFLYMTARGDETQVTKAKQMLTSSIIGLIIVVSAYAIASYLLQLLFFSQGSTASQQAEVEALKAEICAENPNDPVCLGE